MGKRTITSANMVRKIQSAYCKNDSVSIICKCDFGNITINTDHMQMYDTGDIIEIVDDNDNEITINKSSVSNTTLSNVDDGETIDLDLGLTKITFVISNH
jgi:hypothetical protein